MVSDKNIFIFSEFCVHFIIGLAAEDLLLFLTYNMGQSCTVTFYEKNMHDYNKLTTSALPYIPCDNDGINNKAVFIDSFKCDGQ